MNLGRTKAGKGKENPKFYASFSGFIVLNQYTNSFGRQASDNLLFYYLR